MKLFTNNLSLNRHTIVCLAAVLLTSGCSIIEQRRAEQQFTQLKSSADSGQIEAQLRMGREYETGELIERDIDAAISWYQLAASQGSAEGAYRAAILMLDQNLDESDTKVTNLLEQAANQGYAPAQLALADYLSAQGGTDAQDEQIYSLYKAAAEQQLSDAQFKLAGLLTEGRGTPRDLESAVIWYRRAAEQGNKQAQLATGDFYLTGISVPASVRNALDWYEKSAIQGNVQAQSNLGDLLTLDRYAAVRNFSEGARWYQQAANQGHAHAAVRLGLMNENGTENGNRDVTLAAKWYRMAAEKGNSSAQCRLGSLYFRGLGVPQDNEEAERWFELAAAQIPAGVTTLLGFMHYDCKEFDVKSVKIPRLLQSEN